MPSTDGAEEHPHRARRLVHDVDDAITDIPHAAGSVARMVVDPDMPWWECCNDGVRRMHDTGWGTDAAVLSREICALLDDVDVAFAVTGAATPGWPNPYEDGTAPDEAEYERLTGLDEGPARPEVGARSFAGGLGASPLRTRRGRHRPRTGGRRGGLPGVDDAHAGDSEHIFTVTVAADDPAVRLAEIPDCGCDACDRGSAELLAEMDRWVLSVVDGSIEVEVAAGHSSIRTSFGAESGTVRNLERPTAFTATPWPANWTGRALPPKIDTRHP